MAFECSKPSAALIMKKKMSRRLALCSYGYKDEKVLRRRSIINEIVSAAETNFSMEMLEAFIAELKKNFDADYCNYCLQIFYRILSSEIDRSWDETLANHESSLLGCDTLHINRILSNDEGDAKN